MSPVIQPEISDPSDVPYASRSSAWTVLAILIVATMFSYIDRTVLSLLIGPIQREFGVGDVEISLLLGPTFAIFFAATGVPLGWASDRVDRLRLAAVGLALWSVMTALSGLSHEFWELFAARVGVAVGEAVLLPTSTSLVIDMFRPEVRTRRLGLLGMAIYWGTGVALLTGGLLIGAVQHLVAAIPSISGVEPWRIVLILVGSPGLVLAAMLLVLREPPRRNVGTSSPSTLDAGRKGAPIVEYAVLFLAVGLMGVVGYSLSSWAPSHLIRAYGWTAGRAGVSLGLSFLVCTTTVIGISAYTADRLALRGRADAKYITAGTLTLITLPAAIGSGLTGDPYVFVLCCAVMMGCAAGCIAMGPATVCEISPVDRRGRAVGAYQTTVGLIGAGLGPPIVAHVARLDGGSLGLAISQVTTAGFSLSALLFWSRRASYARAVLQMRTALGR